MASQQLFDSYPPFPDIPTANVPSFSLARLASSDEAYKKKLFETCRSTGFFLLQMDEHEDHGILSDIDGMYEGMREVFDLSNDEKRLYAQDASKGNFTGWKDVGIMKVDGGAPDRCEFYALVQDDIMGNVAPRSHPKAIEFKRPTAASFLRRAHDIINLILSIIDSELGLPPGSLASRLRLDQPSGTLLRLIRYAPQPSADRRTSLLSHTDMGAITFLCSVLGGLQILTPGGDPADEKAWRYIRPVPNCAVINIGDALVEWSGGILRSNMHRVTYAPGEQADCVRYSMAYLVRGNKSVNMKRFQSPLIRTAAEDGDTEMDIPCEQWELQKSTALTAGADCAKSRGGRALKSIAVA